MSQVAYRPGKLPHADLARLLCQYTHWQDPRLIVPPGLGEDAAVIDLGGRYLVAKTDPVTFATDAIGWYAVHINANDVAAMGAHPAFFLATVILPAGRATPELAESIFRSIHQAATSLGITVCGGHTEITHGLDRPIVVGQMLGQVTPDALVRSSGLQPGHALILSKGLAIEATAIIARERRQELLQRGFTPALLDRCARYLEDPGISVVRDARTATAAARITAMHDPTEGGVATGLMELAAASQVGLEIQGDDLPVSEESAQMCAAFGLDPLGVISSGALLVGCRSEDAEGVVTALRSSGIPAARIGTVRPPEFGLHLVRRGESRPLPAFAADEITRLFGETT